MHRLIHADGGDREIGSAQVENSAPQEKREQGGHQPGHRAGDEKVDSHRGDQEKPDVSTHSKEDYMAEVYVSRVAQDEVEARGHDDVEVDQEQVLTQTRGAGHERQGRRADHSHDRSPEERSPQCFHHPPRLSSPWGLSNSSTTSNVNSRTGTQLTCMKAVATPSTRPRTIPPSSAPDGLPNPPRTTMRKLRSS